MLGGGQAEPVGFPKQETFPISGAVDQIASCQNVWPLPFIAVDWLVKPDKQKGTTKTGLFARPDQKRDKPACGGHLALLSTGGQSFGTKRPIILANGTDA